MDKWGWISRWMDGWVGKHFSYRVWHLSFLLSLSDSTMRSFSMARSLQQFLFL